MADDLKYQRLVSALLGIAMMDVFTRDGEAPPHEVMREIALKALTETGDLVETPLGW